MVIGCFFRVIDAPNVAGKLKQPQIKLDPGERDTVFQFGMFADIFGVGKPLPLAHAAVYLTVEVCDMIPCLCYLTEKALVTRGPCILCQSDKAAHHFIGFAPPCGFQSVGKLCHTGKQMRCSRRLVGLIISNDIAGKGQDVLILQPLIP